MTQETSDMITRVGFPIVAYIWHVMRTDKKIDNLATAVQLLATNLADLKQKLKCGVM